ncbi:MAG: hypothetical protein D6725_13925 [Planctomycetota bacterium]|nr:MAG: hypothetical protein D6725_13925 [Planctomycetota bacterium]
MIAGSGGRGHRTVRRSVASFGALSVPPVSGRHEYTPPTAGRLRAAEGREQRVSEKRAALSADRSRFGQ